MVGILHNHIDPTFNIRIQAPRKFRLEFGIDTN
jgi:hypothetical protein